MAIGGFKLNPGKKKNGSVQPKKVGPKPQEKNEPKKKEK